MGIAIVGGLLLSQSLTLYTTPVIYLYLDRCGKWIRQRRAVGRPASRRIALSIADPSAAMNVSEPFIRRPAGTSLLAAGLFLAGIVAYRFLPGGGDSAR